jgi:hypothetical protein
VHDLRERGGEVVLAAKSATPEDLDASVEQLAAALEVDDVEVAGCAAALCGRLVGLGAWPDSLARPLLKRLPEVIVAAVRFEQRCHAEADAASREAAAVASGGAEVGGRRVPVRVMQAVAAADAAAAGAWRALESWCLVAITLLTHHTAYLRQAKVCGRLRAAVEQLAASGTRFLDLLLRTLEDERLLVLYPPQRCGFWVRLRHVVDNFQLHVLLAHELCGEAGLPGKRPSPEAVAVMRGDGPQHLPAERSKGVFNLYQWTVLQRNGSLPSYPQREHWVWNQGTPADIGLWVGTRVLVLGPPLYERSWETARVFDALGAEVELVDTLTPREAKGWLKKLGRAERP